MLRQVESDHSTGEPPSSENSVPVTQFYSRAYLSYSEGQNVAPNCSIAQGKEFTY